MPQTCKNCRFFEQILTSEKEGRTGECHRYPPQAAYKETITNETNWEFPKVYESHHCGEWRPILENGNISVYDNK